jgi:hypothetical protein
MSCRTTEDQLRSEYFDLLPHIRRVADELETEVRYLLMPVMRHLESHEKIVVKARVKDCESAIGAIRRRPEYFSSFEDKFEAVAAAKPQPATTD